MTLKEQFELFKSNIGTNWVEVSSKVALYQCMDLALITDDMCVNIKHICLKVLKDFKKGIRIGQDGGHAQITLVRKTQTMVINIAKRLEERLARIRLTREKITRIGKVIMWVTTGCTAILKNIYQSLSYAKDVIRKKLSTYLVMGNIRGNYQTGSGYVANAIMRKMVVESSEMIRGGL